jgi:copper resistance protein B
MLEDPFNASVLADELETRRGDGADPLSWDVRAWLGKGLDRFALRTEGEQVDGDTERAEIQALWAHGITRWWEIVAGVREDFRPSPSRSWAAFGVQGMAPYRFAIEATMFVAEGGDSTARVEAAYELPVTQRWILEPRVEVEWYGQDDAMLGVASGLARAEGALRLRYEITREIAPTSASCTNASSGTAGISSGRQPATTTTRAGSPASGFASELARRDGGTARNLVPRRSAAGQWYSCRLRYAASTLYVRKRS